MTNCNLYKNIQFYGEKKVVDLVGLEPMTVCDQAKFDLNTITTRPRRPLFKKALNLKFGQYSTRFYYIKALKSIFDPFPPISAE